MKQENDTRKKLLDEISNEGKSLLLWAKFNNITDIMCTILSIISSATAAILAGFKLEAGAYVAAVPAVVTSLQKVLDLRGKAIQYYVSARKYTSVTRALEYGELSVKKAAEILNKLDEDLEKRWLATTKKAKQKNR